MEKYSARHCLRHNLAVHYAANNSVQHTQTPNTAANNRVSLRDERKKYTQSSIHIALSRPEPIEKSVQGRCRAVCPAQGVQRGDEIHPCASHGCECLSSQKRLLRGGCYAARSRTQGRGGQSRERNAAVKRTEVKIPNPPQKKESAIDFGTKSIARGAGDSPLPGDF